MIKTSRLTGRLIECHEPIVESLDTVVAFASWCWVVEAPDAAEMTEEKREAAFVQCLRFAHGQSSRAASLKAKV